MTPCSCRVNLHQICWERWVERAGEICVICRAPEPRPPPPIVIIHPAQARLLIGYPNVFMRSVRRVMMVLEFVFIVVIIYFILSGLTYNPPARLHKPLPIPFRLPSQQQQQLNPPQLHDEL